MIDKNQYPVKIEPAVEGGYCVFFQDSIGGATQGETLDEALYMAKDYLMTVFADLFYENKSVPQPEEFSGFTHLIEFTVKDWFEVFDWSQEEPIIVDEYEYPISIDFDGSTKYTIIFQKDIQCSDNVFNANSFEDAIDGAWEFAKDQLIKYFAEKIRNGQKIPMPEFPSPDNGFIVTLGSDECAKIFELAGKTIVLSPIDEFDNCLDDEN